MNTLTLEDNFFFWYGVNKAVEMFTYIYVVGMQTGIY